MEEQSQIQGRGKSTLVDKVIGLAVLVCLGLSGSFGYGLGKGASYNLAKKYYSASHVYQGDVNDDGRTDIMASNAKGDLAVFLQNENGKFERLEDSVAEQRDLFNSDLYYRVTRIKQKAGEVVEMGGGK